jgi:hypothetical protein
VNCFSNRSTNPDIEVVRTIERLMSVPGTVVRDDQLILSKGNNHLRTGDLVYFISKEINLFEHLSIFDKRATPVKRVLIVGQQLYLAAYPQGKGAFGDLH